MCIIHFVALEVILEFTALYLESLKDHQLHEIMHEHPKVVNKCRDIKKRTCFHKVARFVYKIVRALYVSVLFYFIPFFVLFGQLLYTDIDVDSGEDHGGH